MNFGEPPFIIIPKNGGNRARRVGGTSTLLSMYAFCIRIPLQKILSSKKSSASEFLNLPHAREARGEPVSPYAALRAARSSVGEMPLSLIMVSLLKHARTYFAQHPTQ